MKYVLKRAKKIKELLPKNFNRIKGVGTLKDRGCGNDAARRNITNFFPKVSSVRTNKFFSYKVEALSSRTNIQKAVLKFLKLIL